MNLLQGKIPEHSAWRAMALFAPGEEPGAAWELSRALARAHGGEVLAVVLCSDAAAATYNKAEETLSRALELCDEDEVVISFIVAANDFQAALRTFTVEADVDVLLAWADGPQWYRLDRLGCLVMAIRGDIYRAYREPEEGEKEGEDGRALTSPAAPFRRILIPTVGGPDTGLALTYLTRLTPEVELTTLYVAREDQGENAVALGRARLRQLLNFVDGSEEINTKIIQASSPTAGIIDEANQGYDLVILGASHESSLDRALFGDVVGEVVRQSKIPVVVAREGAGRRVGNFFRTVAWQLQRFVPRMNVNARTEAYVRIRRNARPTMDFFILIGLSAIIAAFGLLLSSPAVVIGAMLVAPLMSPIVGVGLAIVLGDTRFVRLTITTVVRGAALGLFVGVLAGLLPGEGGLTPEVMARTQPTLLDLGVALFSGIAGAYALCKSEAAGALPGVAIAAALVPPLASSGIAFAGGFWAESFGALLLFTTNFIAIASAAALVFITLGFRPSTAQKDRRAVQLRSFRLAALFLGIIVVLLSATTFQLARESATTDLIFDAVRNNANELENVEFDGLNITSFEEGILALDVTVRSTEAIGQSAVENLRDQIGADLQAGGVELERVALDLTVIRITKLDPEVPPTPTPTPTPSNTPPPDSSATPTATLTPTPSPTGTPTAAPTATPSPTGTPTTTPTASPTSSPTVTPTPTMPTAIVDAPYGLNLRAEPNPSSELLAFISAESTLILLEGQETVNGDTWQEVLFEGQSGWVLAEFLNQAPSGTEE